MTISDFLSPKR